MSICLADISDRSAQEGVDRVTKTVSAYILIVDRTPAPIVHAMERYPAASAYTIVTVATGTAALERLTRGTPVVVIMDTLLPDQCGLELQHQIRARCPNIPVIFTSSVQSAGNAIRAMKSGAYDYLFKPLDEAHFHRVLDGVFELAAGTTVSSPIGEPKLAAESEGDLCGNCPLMRDVYKSIGLVAGQDVNVLITGESGTGKELVARAIYQHSARAGAPFLALNCAAIPENLLESELFGHEKGAFSGADRRRIGKFEEYNGGTILLDEIGDMSLNLQAKILRLIQEQTFERVGGNEIVRTNVRILASTHRDLKAWAAQDKFRADLYYRLSVYTIELPPLRRRGDDIPALVRHFLNCFSRQMGRDISEISPAAMTILQHYHWPGNIRELQSVLRQAVLRSYGPVLLPSFLPTLSERAESGVPETPVRSTPTSNADFDIDRFLNQRLSPDARDLYADLHREVDRYYLARVLDYTRGNRHMASRVLGIARQTLRMKLRESGVHVTHAIETDDAA